METNKSHLTAITRKSLSLPMKYLTNNGLLFGRVLDYGSGRGFDADFLQIERFDPYYFPHEPNGLYNTITCNYVLNVVDTKVQQLIISKIYNLLKPNGIAYFTVRRDNFKEGFTKKGTYQRLVKLDKPFELLFQKKSQFTIYKLQRQGGQAWNGKILSELT
jgi:SAM-dependent methyltransferase